MHIGMETQTRSHTAAGSNDRKPWARSQESKRAEGRCGAMKSLESPSEPWEEP